MDNFNLQSYIASGKLHADSTILTEDKKQGYDDREDESLGARKGAEKGKKQSMKDRRDDSYGKFGKRDAEKKGKNKINKESLSETIAEAKSKIGEGSYPFDQCLSDNEGKYGKKGAAKVCGFIKAQYGEGQVNEKQDSKKGNESEQKRMEGAIKDDRDHIKDLKKDIKDNERKLARLKKDYKKDVIKEDENDQSWEEKIGNDINANSLLDILAEYLPTNHYHQDKTLSYDEALEMVTEFVKFVGMDSTGEDFLIHIADTEGSIKEGYGKPMYDEDDIEDALKKMKVSELKDKIKTEIISNLSEAEEDVDVDIDVEDEVEVDAEADDIEIERKGVKAKVEVGLSPEEEIVQDSLKAAMDAAQALGSDKLADQIGNTITFFTRQFVVGNNTD